MNKKYIYLDFDGTLVDSREDICLAVNTARETLSMSPLQLEEVTRHIGHGVRYLAENCLPGVRDAYRYVLEAYHNVPFRFTRAYDGVEESLNDLASKYQLIIVSNKPEALIHAVNTALGWGKLFSAVFGGDSFPVKKPDVKIHMSIEEKLKFKGKPLAMIGDMQPDAELAHALDIAYIHCVYGYSKGPVFAGKKTTSLQHFSELKLILEKLNLG